MRRQTELLARAVISRRGRFLVARPKGGSYCYLPGGHVEPGESLRRCLQRELREELGARAVVGRYLGALEHAWTDRAGRHHEVNHLFAVRVRGVGSDPASREPGLEFLWLRADELRAHGLEPAPLREYLARRRRPSGGWWGSTVERPSGRRTGGVR